MTTKLAKQLKKSAALLFGTSLAMLDGIHLAHADTQLRLEILGEQQRVIEGYHGSQEVLEAVRARHGSLDSSSTLRHRYDYEEETQVASVGLSLSRDNDHDGYFSAFSVTFDVDTYDDAEIYASLTLRSDRRGYQFLHTTETFHIYNTSPSDEYRVEVELLDNYEAAHYDLQIDIYDAYTNQLLDSVGADDFTNLCALPLEGDALSAPYINPTAVPANDGNAMVVEYAGATTPLGLGLFGLLAFVRRLRYIRRSQ
ncbi:MAG: choice-of-anchor H family protein [Granulosicoccus sp.]